MDDFEVAREETRNMLRKCIPLLFFAYAVFALFGYYQWNHALSLVLGTAYMLFNFRRMAFTAVRAAHSGDQTRARQVQSSGYFVRYALTALLLIAAIKLPLINAVAVAIPLFFPQIILIASGIFQKKGG